MRIVTKTLTISPNRIRRSSRMAAGVDLPKSRIVAAFKFPPNLSMKHEEELRKRAISKEFALASGIRTAADSAGSRSSAEPRWRIRRASTAAMPPCGKSASPLVECSQNITAETIEPDQLRLPRDSQGSSSHRNMLDVIRH
jgi:hypothetical protein